MCLILVAWRVHPEYPLVVAANRDEFFARPSAALAWWADQPGILGGRDLEHGGSWLAASRTGRIAALTNFRDPAHRRSDAPSRGDLVSGFLHAETGVGEALQGLARDHARYNGFNLVLYDGESLAVFESPAGAGRILAPGIYGLSNAQLDTPWPKVTQGRSRLEAALSALPEPGPILAMLHDDRPAPDASLPDTGVGLAWERLLSSAFIRARDYGTRCSTLALVHRSGRIALREWSWRADGSLAGENDADFLPDRGLPG